MVGRGFTALKFDPFPGPWRLYISREDEAAAIGTVYAVRDAVGPDIDLLIEVHRRLAPMHAVRVADAIRGVDPFWFEEPCPAENVDALAEVRSRTDIPIVAGETLYTKAAFRELFEKRAVDIINPDVCNTGGILETKGIAAMAEPYYVGVSPHNYNSVGVALASTVHVSACIPNFVITEYWVNFEPVVENIMLRSPQVERDTSPCRMRPVWVWNWTRTRSNGGRTSASGRRGSGNTRRKGPSPARTFYRRHSFMYNRRKCWR